VRVLTTLLRPDSGRALVDGIDVVARPGAVRRRIGLAGQYAAVDENLTGRENLRLFGTLYRLEDRAAARPTSCSSGSTWSRPPTGWPRPTPAACGAGSTWLPPWSTGRRCCSSTSRPPGLDPRSRLALWDVIEDLVDGGTTLLLTTQYLEEADRLADRIAVIDNGRVIAEGTATSSRPAPAASCSPCAWRASDVDAARARWRRSASRAGRGRQPGRPAPRRRRLRRARRAAARRRRRRRSTRSRCAGPTLDDVFLQLTGRPPVDDADEEPAA
jgi:ABC-2 type transport system ATP-binding protein